MFDKYVCFGCTWENSGSDNTRISFSNPIRLTVKGFTETDCTWTDGSNP